MRGLSRSPRRGTADPPPADLPPYADWWWRADFGPPRSLAATGPDAPLSETAALHHDCPLGEVLVRPDGPRATVEVFGFRGTFLGLSIAPVAALEGLRRRHVLRVDLHLSGTAAAFARLNLRAGDTVETQLRDLSAGGDGPRRAEFDLAAARADTARLDHLWIDLLFDAPRAARIVVADTVLVRRPRADL